MAYVIGVDCGTSGTKTVLFRENGTVMASATVEYPMYQPKNGYAEQDPADWKNAMIQTIQAVVAKSGAAKEEIKGIGISGQMHGLVMLDKDNQVLRNSIIWCDQRTAAEVDEMNRTAGQEKLMEITANPALTGWTAAKILWVRNNEPEVYEKCRHILLPKDYLRLILTGEYATEVSDASGMQLLDVAHRCWSDELLHLLQSGCQVGRLLRTESGQALLCGGQLLLERILACMGGGAVAACQGHDGVHLGVGQTFDCSQILALHSSSLWATALLRPAGDLPNPPDSARRQRSCLYRSMDSE